MRKSPAAGSTSLPTYYLQKGILETPNSSLIVEELPGTNRVKRDSDLAETDMEGHVVVYESVASLGACGLKPNNLQRMRAPPISAVSLAPVVKLELDETDDDSAANWEGNKTAFGRQRREVPGDAGSPKTKAIELAVFVDDDLFRRESAPDASGDGDPVQAIQDIVFTYLNSVGNGWLPVRSPPEKLLRAAACIVLS